MNEVDVPVVDPASGTRVPFSVGRVSAEDAPVPAAEALEGMACPVSFDSTADGDLATALVREVEELTPWHDLAARRRKRTTTGLSGLTMADAAKFVVDYLHGAPVASQGAISAGETLKIVCDDLRAYYYEAAVAKPGNPDARAVNDWFWHDTAASRAFLELQKICAASADRSLQVLGGGSLIPRAIMHARGV